jgi:hypothetical protein
MLIFSVLVVFLHCDKMPEKTTSGRIYFGSCLQRFQSIASGPVVRQSVRIKSSWWKGADREKQTDRQRQRETWDKICPSKAHRSNPLPPVRPYLQSSHHLPVTYSIVNPAVG